MPKQAAARGWTRGSETASTSRSGLLCTRTAQYYEQYYRVPLFTLFRSPQPTQRMPCNPQPTPTPMRPPVCLRLRLRFASSLLAPCGAPWS